MVYEWCKPCLFVLTLAVFGFPTAKKDQDFEVGLVFGQQETKGDNKFEVNWLLRKWWKQKGRRQAARVRDVDQFDFDSDTFV